MRSQEYKDYNYEAFEQSLVEALKQKDIEAYEIFQKTREDGRDIDSNILITIALVIEKILSEYFNIEKLIQEECLQANFESEIYTIKRNFLQRYIATNFSHDSLFNKDEIEKSFYRFSKIKENDLSKIDDFFISYLSRISNYDLVPIEIKEYAAYRYYLGPSSKLFSKVEKLDFANLIKYNREKEIIIKDSKNNEIFPSQESLYCIKCHHNLRDSCSKGLFKNKEIQVNPLNNSLEGCPLKIKISEMNELYSKGHIIAALAIAIRDNPFLVLTGHRICNDCSKACIFQKQQPVDVPSIESSLVRKIMNLDYGFEIYYILTRWNPLSEEAKLSDNFGKKILVVGSGPSAIALSYYLLREGAEVLMIEGQKVEPLPSEPISKIKDYSLIKEIYKKIKPQGFGGVCEYGITDRWNKENLISARIILERFPNFNLIGGIKYGSNITYEDAIGLGFDHIALCCGAGAPHIPLIKNINAGNVRSASDFLMAVGSGDILDTQSKTNFMITLPAYVIGGGLTAVDAATELAKYYPVLARKVRDLYYKDNFDLGKDIAKVVELIAAAKLFDEEDIKAKNENRKANYKNIISQLGGIYLCYRREIEKSPAYRINHEELDDGLTTSFYMIDNADLVAINQDDEGNINNIELNINGKVESKIAKTVLYAIGSSNNNSCSSDPKISIFGDMDSRFSGSVVKAIASAKYGYKKLLSSIDKKESESKITDYSILKSYVTDIIHFNNDVFELKIKNKFAAKNFKPGQFFKLLNFHATSTKSFEPLALTGAYVQGDIVSLIAQKVGSSSIVASKLSVGERVELMGPLGEASKITKNSNVLLIGGGVGNAALFEYARLLKQNGNKITWIAGYRKTSHIVYHSKIIDYSDKAIFVCDEEMPKFFYPKDKISCMHGNIISAIRNIDLKEIDYLFVVGSVNLMKVIEEYTRQELMEKKASINAPMCCMMGGICGQCILEIKKDGNIYHEFICKNQDQDLNDLTINTLQIRLKQNSLLEKLVNY